ncbi:MAG TPA: SIS domain-containing protein [Candidatus Dormibacteraeota bacterium]
MPEAHEPGSYLRATLDGQPSELARILADNSARLAAKRLAGSARVFIVGTGTSYHGALVGQFMLRSAGIEAWAVRAFEFANYGPELRDGDGLILLSHRGTKRFSKESLDAFASRSDRWIAITGAGAPLEGEGVVRTVDQERSPVHTASHTGAMLRLAQIASALGEPPWVGELEEIPTSAGWVIDEYRDMIASDAREIELGGLVHFVGGGPARATAYEGALKIREATHVISAEGHDVEGVLHGPLISIQRGQAVVVVAHAGKALERTIEVARALSDIGARLILVGGAADDVAGLEGAIAVQGYRTLPHHEVLAPIVNVIPLQLLAYAASRHAGVDADSFRRDEPEYAAAQDKFRL